MSAHSEEGNPKPSRRRPKVLAISSTGGHWIQMLRLRPAFEGCDVTFSTTNLDYRSDVEGHRFRKIIDANRTQKFKLIASLLSVAWVVVSEWPDTILTTGAAPGFFALRLGKLFGIRTIWLDSIANAEELSLSGQKAGKHATLWLTQWKHLARPEGPSHFGNVLGDAPDRIQSETPNDSSPSTSPKIQNPTTKRIFATVGSDVPFDRMINALDQWAMDHPDYSVFAQVGNTTNKPQHIEYAPFLNPVEFADRVEQSDLIVGHAGMGTILTALSRKKPVLVMPRFGYLGETRNEHQVATVNHLAPLGIIQVASDEKELPEQLDSFNLDTAHSRLKPYATRDLTQKLNQAIRTIDPLNPASQEREVANDVRN